MGTELKQFTESTRMNIRTLVLGLAVMSFGALSAQAGIIVYFDDLPGTTVSVPLANGYQGFEWTGWSYLTDASGNNYALSGTGGAASITRTDGYHFDFDGVDLAADSGSTTVTVKGYSGNFLVGTEVYSRLTTGFTFQGSSLKGIDRVEFAGSDAWRMDVFRDAIVVPEPATSLAGALLLLAFLASTLRRLRKRHNA